MQPQMLHPPGSAWLNEKMVDHSCSGFHSPVLWIFSVTFVVKMCLMVLGLRAVDAEGQVEDAFRAGNTVFSPTTAAARDRSTVKSVGSVLISNS